MSSYEYITVPAPMRSEKTKGSKTPADRYAVTLTDAINAMATNGWEYLRAETLPSEERSGLTGRTTVFHNLLIFRREVVQAQASAAPLVTPAPAPKVDPRHATGVEPAAPVKPSAPAESETAAPSPVFSEKPAFAAAPRTTGDQPSADTEAGTKTTAD